MNSTMSQKPDSLFTSQKILWIIIGIGIALRLVRYVHNTPFWFDESVYAVDIINRSFQQLFEPSNVYTQTGALNFFLLYKIASVVFGTSEYAFRFFSLFFSILSILLFYRVAGETVSKNALPVALLLFAVLDPLVYYAAEFKTYSLDVVVALLVLLMMNCHTKILSVTDIVVMSLTGLFSIVSSNSAVFMLAGVGLGLLISNFRRKQWHNMRPLLIVFVIWVFSLAVIHVAYTRVMTAHIAEKIGIAEAMQMEKFIMPFPPTSMQDIKWFIDFFFETFLFQDSIQYVKNVTARGLMALSFLAGSVVLFLEKRDRFFMLMLPILITLSASMLQLYPFKGRLIVFLIPVFLIFISEGAEYIRNSISRKSLLIGSMFLLLLFIYPVSWAAYHAKNPIIRSEIRPVFQHIQHNWQEGDIMYIHFFAQYEALYYIKYHPNPFPFREEDYVIGIGPRGWYNKWSKDKIPERYTSRGIVNQTSQDLEEEYIADLERIRGYKRVWIIFGGDISKEQFFLSYLDGIGQRVDTFGKSGLAITYLYALAPEEFL